MSTDAGAYFGYGISLKNYRSDPEDLDDLDGFDIGFHGDSYGDSTATLILVGESAVSVFTFHDEPEKISPDKFVAKPGWDDKLKNFCQKNKLGKKKPAWYLAASL